MTSMRLAKLPIVAALVTLFAAAMPAAADEAALSALVTKKAGVLQLLHGKAERALVTAAQDKRFESYFASTSDEERAKLRDSIDHILLGVQKDFAVEEMCLIDPTGTEISRVVGKEIAYDLSTEEASNAFFAPGFAQAVRSVYQAPAYISQDAHRWVLAYVTPVVFGGVKRAILHYEHGLDYYQHALNAGVASDGARVLIAVTRDGFIVSDSRSPIAIEQVGESEAAADYFKPFAFGGLRLQDVVRELGHGASSGGGVLTQDGKAFDVAFATVGDWVLIAFEQRGLSPT